MSEKNRLPRLLFAHEQISGSDDEWERVVLNPIENLWAELNFLKYSKMELEGITEKFLHQLIESMPCRCKVMIKSKGVPTKY